MGLPIVGDNIYGTRAAQRRAAAASAFARDRGADLEEQAAGDGRSAGAGAYARVAAAVRVEGDSGRRATAGRRGRRRCSRGTRPGSTGAVEPHRRELFGAADAAAFGQHAARRCRLARRDARASAASPLSRRRARAFLDRRRGRPAASAPPACRGAARTETRAVASGRIPRRDRASARTSLRSRSESRR